MLSAREYISMSATSLFGDRYSQDHQLQIGSACLYTKLIISSLSHVFISSFDITSLLTPFINKYGAYTTQD